MTYRLVPKPGGFYQDFEHALELDLEYLIDADTHALNAASRRYFNLRAEALVERVNACSK
jgi:hypothetical protein